MWSRVIRLTPCIRQTVLPEHPGFPAIEDLFFTTKVKTTGLAGGLHKPYKGILQQRLKALELVRQSQLDYWLPPAGGGLLFAFDYWLTRKRVCELSQTDLVRGYVLL